MVLEDYERLSCSQEDLIKLVRLNTMVKERIIALVYSNSWKYKLMKSRLEDAKLQLKEHKIKIGA